MSNESENYLNLNCEDLESRQMLSTVDIFAAGVTNQESIQLKINETVVQTWENLGGDAYGNQFVRLTYETPDVVDPSDIKIEFINDLFDAASGTDRNVRVDRIEVDGTVIQTESPGVFSTGTWKPEDGVVPGFRQSEYLHTDGYFQYPGQAAGSNLQLRVRGDEGTEQFNLLINGQSVGQVGVTTDWSIVNYTHDEKVIASDVRIEFVNDQWDPAAGVDSNLYVDNITIDGVVYETEDNTVYSTGTWTPDDGIVPGFGRGETLNTSGYFQYSGGELSETGSRILVRAKGTTGTELFQIVIDGQVAGTFAATSTTDFQTIAYTHTSQVLPTQIRIQFINDRFDAAQGVDANLLVDFIVVDGKAYQTENPAVFSTGTWKPEDGVAAGFRESETLHTNGFFEFADSNYLVYADLEGDGEWSDVEPMGLIAIHSMVLPDGKVFSFGTDERGMQGGQFIYSLYDPETGVEVILPNTTDTDIFCSNMSLDPLTGNVLITGGDARGEGGPVNGPVNDVVVFDYESLTIRDATQGEMDYARWYGSSVTLPNGEIFVLGGTGGGKDIPEVFNAVTGWRTLTGVDININYYYPKTWVTSDGNVVVFSTQGDIYKIDPSGVGSSEKIGRVNAPNTSAAPNIMYDVDKVAFVGSDAKIYTADLSQATPVFTAVAEVSSFRRDGGMVPLADGRIALVGGSRSFNVLSTAVYTTEIWDPRTNEIEVVESLQLGRLYHSTHLLLPDGTVWSGGGGAPGPLKNLNVEIYAPDYLYGSDRTLAERPEITAAPKNVENSSTFRITVDDASVIERVTAVRSGALTHGVNNDARFLELSFLQVDANTIEITTPGRNTMIPGTWMMFVLDENGVPSEASLLGVSMVDVVDTPHLR